MGLRISFALNSNYLTHGYAAAAPLTLESALRIVFKNETCPRLIKGTFREAFHFGLKPTLSAMKDWDLSRRHHLTQRQSSQLPHQPRLKQSLRLLPC